MKKLIQAGAALGLVAAALSAHALSVKTCQQLFPHWNCHNAQVRSDLAKIDAAINRYAHKGVVAASDWDGTLYNERIKIKSGPLKGQRFSGQATWLINTAPLLAKHPAWFPLEQGQTPYLHSGDALLNQVLFLEGKTNAPTGDFAKFSAYGKLTAGMSTKGLYQSIQAYLKTYPAKDYAFLPMFDIMQVMHDKGYKMWVITGSNPYFTAETIQAVQKLDYKPGVKYHLGIIPKGYHGVNPGHIAGNGGLVVDGHFINVYNRQFTNNPHAGILNHKRFPVDREGKALAMKYYIQPHEKAPVVFYMGNSAGDYQAAQYLLGQHRHQYFVVAVKPQGEHIGTLQHWVNQYPKQTVKVHMHSRVD